MNNAPSIRPILKVCLTIGLIVCCRASLSFAQPAIFPVCSGDTIPGKSAVYLPAITQKEIADDAGKRALRPFELQGFRVQVFNGNNRDEANRIQSLLQRVYPLQTVYISYMAPNYRVRIGDYRSYMEALPMIITLRKQYEGVMIVPDKIIPPKIE